MIHFKKSKCWDVSFSSQLLELRNSLPPLEKNHQVSSALQLCAHLCMHCITDGSLISNSYIITFHLFLAGVRVYGWGGVKSVCLSTFCFMCNRSLRYTGQILLLSHLSNEKTKVQKLREWPKVTAWQGQGRNRFLFPSPISLISQIATSQQKGQGTER